MLPKNAFYKKSFICKEKAGTVTKVKLQKLLTKIKKHNQLYFGICYCYCRNTGFRKISNMALKKISE